MDCKVMRYGDKAGTALITYPLHGGKCAIQYKLLPKTCAQ